MTIIDLLEECNISIISASTGNTDSVWCECPFCGKDKLYIYNEDWPHHVKCFSDGGHISTTLVGLYAKVKHLSYNESLNIVSSKLKLTFNPSQWDKKKSLDKEIFDKVDILKEIPKEWIPINYRRHTNHVKYLRSRGINKDNVDKYDVRWNGLVHDYFVLFPVREDDKIVSYELRCIVKEEDWEFKRKYFKTQGPPGINNPNFLYGIDFVPYHCILYLVEGIPNYFTLINTGFSAVSIFGSNPSDRQLRLIKQLDPIKIVLAYDGDVAGIKAVDKTHRLVHKHFKDMIIDYWLIPNKKDINDLGKNVDDLMNSHDNRQVETLKSYLSVFSKGNK